MAQRMAAVLQAPGKLCSLSYVLFVVFKNKNMKQNPKQTLHFPPSKGGSWRPNKTKTESKKSRRVVEWRRNWRSPGAGWRARPVNPTVDCSQTRHLSPLSWSCNQGNAADAEKEEKATHSSNVIVKFADDTTVIGLITDNDETAYREEVSTLTKWCQENHLSLNIDKTKELVVDYRRQSREHTPITIDKTPGERVNSFKFLGVHIIEDLTWSAHTDAVLKKAHQRLFFLRRLRKFGTSPRILRSFYTCTVESILNGCITAWFGNSTAGNRRALQRVVRTARHIVGGELPSLQDIYTRRCTRKARRIIKDSSHPSHSLLSLLPSGRRFRSIRSRTSRLRDSFFPQAIRLMNSQKWPTLQHTPTHTTCHALHFNKVQLDYTHTLH